MLTHLCVMWYVFDQILCSEISQALTMTLNLPVNLEYFSKKKYNYADDYFIFFCPYHSCLNGRGLDLLSSSKISPNKIRVISCLNNKPVWSYYTI